MVVSQFFLNVSIGMCVTLHNSYIICDAQVNHGGGGVVANLFTQICEPITALKL